MKEVELACQENSGRAEGKRRRFQGNGAQVLAHLSEKRVRERFAKPCVEIWRELREESVYPVLPEEKSVSA